MNPRHLWRGKGWHKEWDDGVEQQRLKEILQFERKNPWMGSIEKVVGGNRHQ